MAAILLLTATAIHILIASHEQRGSSWIYLIFWLAPWVLNFANVVWKDVLLGSLLLLASSLVVSNTRHPKKSKIFLVAVVLSIALGTRANAILAVFPFLAYSVWSLAKQSTNKVQGIASAFAVVSLTISPSILVGPAFGATPGYGADHPMVDDLAVISMASGKSLIPQRSLGEIYECEKSAYFGLPRNGFIRCLNGYNFGEDGLRGKISTSLWLDSIVGNLDVYLPHAVDKYWAFLWHSGQPYSYARPSTATSNPELPDEVGWNFQGNTSSYIKDGWVVLWAQFLPIFFLPLFWLILSVSLFLANLPRKLPDSSVIQLILSSSSVLYLLSYAIFNHAADFRYALWPTWAVTISILILVAESFGSRTNRRDSGRRQDTRAD